MGEFQVVRPISLSFDITNGTPGANITGDLSVANLDGTGANIVLASPSGGIMVLGWPGANNEFPANPVLAQASFEKISGACGGVGMTGGGMPPAAQSLRAAAWPSNTFVRNQLPSGAPIPTQALVVVTSGGVTLLEYDGSGGFKQDPNNPGQYPCLQDDTSTPLIGGSAIATGDFDGDGIDDIAVSDDTGVTIYYGNSYAPGQGRLAPTDAGAP
jgi:hypothetical protein